MPNKLRLNVSGKELMKFFESYGFILNRKRGSHLILSRKLSFGNQILVIPEHKIIPKGTLKAIIGQSTKYISEEDFFNQFYSK